MTKKKGRGAGRELSRAEIKAFERRAAGTTPLARTAVAEPAAGAAPDDAPAAPRRTGVLPPRTNRVAVAQAAISREQELLFIRHDLQRLTWLTVAMLVIIVALTFFLR